MLRALTTCPSIHPHAFRGFLPATPYNKINIHVGGVYGDKIASMDRFAKVGDRVLP